jgi:hypothetical protein
MDGVCLVTAKAPVCNFRNTWQPGVACLNPIGSASVAAINTRSNAAAAWHVTNKEEAPGRRVRENRHSQINADAADFMRDAGTAAKRCTSCAQTFSYSLLAASDLTAGDEHVSGDAVMQVDSEEVPKPVPLFQWLHRGLSEEATPATKGYELSASEKYSAPRTEQVSEITACNYVPPHARAACPTAKQTLEVTTPLVHHVPGPQQGCIDFRTFRRSCILSGKEIHYGLADPVKTARGKGRVGEQRKGIVHAIKQAPENKWQGDVANPEEQHRATARTAVREPAGNCRGDLGRSCGLAGGSEKAAVQVEGVDSPRREPAHATESVLQVRGHGQVKRLGASLITNVSSQDAPQSTKDGFMASPEQCEERPRASIARAALSQRMPGPLAPSTAKHSFGVQSSFRHTYSTSVECMALARFEQLAHRHGHIQ